METLLFSNPVFHEGINVTVRNGGKWATLVAIGDLVNIATTAEPDKVLRRAQIMGKLQCRAEDIPGGILLEEHDPSCLVPHGLFSEMRRVYGKDWTEKNWVTILFFLP